MRMRAFSLVRGARLVSSRLRALSETDNRPCPALLPFPVLLQA